MELLKQMTKITLKTCCATCFLWNLSGVSQRQYKDSCGNTTWRNEGTACSASYNCANYSDSGDCPLGNAEGTWTCRGSGTQTANGSTTSAAQSAARAKCTCSTYSATASGKCGATSCDGSEDGCSYTGTMTGNWSGSASGGSASGTTCLAAALNGAGDCTCGSRTYTYKTSYAANDSDCNNKCPNGGTSKGNAITGTGSGSSCSTAKSQAEGNRIAEFNRNYTSYCNCNSAVNQWTSTSSITSCTSYSIEVRVCAVKKGNPAATMMRYGLRRNGVKFGSPGEYEARVSPTASNNCFSNSFSTNGVSISNCNGISIWVTFD